MWRILRRLLGRETEEELRARLLPESRYVVTVDERGVGCRAPSGEVGRTALDELDSVVVETNDTGPWGTDLYWVLAGRDGRGYLVPGGATGDDRLLERLQRLPGFDNEQLTEAMRSTQNRTFVCWRREQSG